MGAAAMSTGEADRAKARVAKWTRAAVAGVLEDLRSTSGGRNAALLAASSALGSFVAHGLWDDEDGLSTLRAEDLARDLLAACEANGYTRKDGQRTAAGVIRRGLQLGAKQPKALPHEIADALRVAHLGGGRMAPRPAPSPAPVRVLEDVTATAPGRGGKPYPPEDELRAVWDALGPVPIPTIERLGGKPRPGISAYRVDPEGLARMLPEDVAALPRWAKWWAERGLRVVAPIFDAEGRMRGLRARHPAEKAERPIYERSERAPDGFCSTGAVFASRIGRRLLEGDPEARELAAEWGVEIVEGFPAYLARATWHGGGWGPVWGIFSGAWTRAHADRIPDGCTVTIDPDPDGGGERYAAKIEATLAERWRAGRLTVMHSARWAAYLASKGER